jgi:Na+/H+-dicarboxylate symporter
VRQGFLKGTKRIVRCPNDARIRIEQLDVLQGRFPSSFTALGTGSLVATIRANPQAADNIGVAREISEVVIPVGVTIPMEGSCLAAVLKSAFYFGIYQVPFSGVEPILAALGIAFLTGGS